MLTLRMLPADYGDCLWLEFGGRKPGRVLVDCGTQGTWPRLKAEIERLPLADRRFDLVVITHIDIDHIGGALPFFREFEALGVQIGEVWFNGWDQIQPALLGVRQGDELTKLLGTSPLSAVWNKAFRREAAVVPADGALPVVEYGDLRLTLLSPTWPKLEELAKDWDQWLRENGLLGELEEEAAAVEESPVMLGDEQPLNVDLLAASRFKPDKSVPNGSSIAFLAELKGEPDSAILMGADAHVPVLLESMARLRSERGLAADHRLRCAAVKLPHHGSKSNVSAEWVAQLDARRYLFSTSGARFGHPDPEAVARVIKAARGAQLVFNYQSPEATRWDDDGLRTQYDYSVEYSA